MSDILVIYYSRDGATEALAREVCRGVDSVDGMAARLRTVPPVSSVAEASASATGCNPVVVTVLLGRPTLAGNADVRPARSIGGVGAGATGHRAEEAGEVLCGVRARPARPQPPHHLGGGGGGARSRSAR